MKIGIFTIVMSLLLLLSCNYTQNLLDKQKYDKALFITSEKLKRKKVNPKFIPIFEQSFSLVFKKKNNQITNLKQSGQSDAWPLIFKLAKTFRTEQRAYKQIVLDLKKKGFSVRLNYKDYEPIIEEAREKSAIYYYALAQEYLIQGRNGNRQSARRAYKYLKSCLIYNPDFRDAQILSDEMYEAGTTDILLKAKPELHHSKLADKFLNKIKFNNTFPKRYGWQRLYLGYEEYEGMDYVLDYYFSKLYVSGDCETRSTCSNSKEIEDGYVEKKVWSQKDSTYITVKEKVYKTIDVSVTEIEQSKSAEARLQLNLYDVATKELIKKETIRQCASWSNTYGSYSGDSRALNISCDDPGGFCQGFPSDNELLSEAVNNAIRAFKKRVKRPFE